MGGICQSSAGVPVRQARPNRRGDPDKGKTAGVRLPARRKMDEETKDRLAGLANRLVAVLREADDVRQEIDGLPPDERAWSVRLVEQQLAQLEEQHEHLTERIERLEEMLREVERGGSG